LFYVAATRGREHVLVITSDKERLCESVAQSTARKSASELQRSERYPDSRGPHFLQPVRRQNPLQERLEKIEYAAQDESGSARVGIEAKAKTNPLALPADPMNLLDDAAGGRRQPTAKGLDTSFIAAEVMSKKILGPQVGTLVAQTESGIYRGEIIGETETHVLQRLSARMVIAHVKQLLHSVPGIGSEVSIVYSRQAGAVHEIPSRKREKELSR